MQLLSVLIPTFRRPATLEKTLASLAAARIPKGLSVEVCVVDNNSQDATEAIVRRWQDLCTGRLRLLYVLELQQGISYARNAGLHATSGELVATVDDDETISPQWYEVIARAFEQDTLHFIGGPYVPDWEHEPPKWLPTHTYPGVVGCLDCGPEIVEYGPEVQGFPWGGNAVYRREWILRVGPWATDLGRAGHRLATGAGEDFDLYKRLKAAGARGMYSPELIIYHWVPTHRMTRQYHRRWVFWGAHSDAREEALLPGPKWLDVCRWRYRKALRGAYARFKGSLTRGGLTAEAFTGELHVIELLGVFAGRHGLRRPR